MLGRQPQTNIIYATLQLGALSFATASPHGSGHESEMMQHGSANNLTSSIEWSDSFKVPNYFRHPSHGVWIYSHILLMTVSWAMLLPLSVMFSIGKSRYTVLLQFCFFAFNGIGLAVGTVYNANTPDLYDNNSHHKVGWIFTWISLAWILLGIFNTYAAKSNLATNSLKSYSNAYQRLSQPDQTRRWSGDSGNGTDRQSSICTTSPSSEQDHPDFQDNEEIPSYSSDTEDGDAEKRGFLRGTKVDRFLLKHVQKYAMGKTLMFMRICYAIFERTIIILAFVAFCSGFVTWGGIFRGSEVFSGLAHFVKGGIFFWIGALAIGRWAGAFADLGWAWNVKPPLEAVGRWKAAAPSSEFVESALICFYGVSNVWLEHLNAWGEAWSPMDYEHVSITILFFGGGLLGLLIESKRVRKFLNMSLIVAQPGESHFQPDSTGATPTQPTWSPPMTATTPLNPLPALTILLLGLIMSAHAQHSGLASTMHTMWGALFAFGAGARMTTYLLNYIRPPVSYIPSRPPTELITGFTLVAGGFMFMISARDITDALEGSGADAMVAFVVSMGFTAIICAGVVTALAAKGWAVAREHQTRLNDLRSQGARV